MSFAKTSTILNGVEMNRLAPDDRALHDWYRFILSLPGDPAWHLRVMIRTGQILADLAASLGYEVVGIDLFRTRAATATREQLREEVVVLKWRCAS